MTKLVATPWFDWTEKPVHVGLYEVRYPGKPNEYHKRYWDGKQFCWLYGGYDPDVGCGLPCGFGERPETQGQWRGVQHALVETV